MPVQFEIILSRQAAKYYKRLPNNIARRIDRAFILLEKDPWAGLDIKPLKNMSGRYRLRIGDLRIIYTISKNEKQILVSTILPRGEVYKK